MTLLEIIEGDALCCEQEREDKRMMLWYLDNFPDALLHTNETAHFSASGWVVNPARDRVLMLYHNIYNF